MIWDPLLQESADKDGTQNLLGRRNKQFVEAPAVICKIVFAWN